MQNSKTDTSSTASSSRRRWLGWTLASVAAGAAGVAGWRQFGPRQAPVPEAVAGVPERWLTHEFAQPGQIGTRTLESFQGKPLLFNLWATWCPPCVEELPLLSAFYSENKANGWHLLGLAVDKPAPVTQFLARTPVSFPVALAGLEGTELSRTLGNNVGALPFSVLFDADGRIHQRKIGQLDAAELARWKG